MDAGLTDQSEDGNHGNHIDAGETLRHDAATGGAGGQWRRTRRGGGICLHDPKRGGRNDRPLWTEL